MNEEKLLEKNSKILIFGLVLLLGVMTILLTIIQSKLNYCYDDKETMFLEYNESMTGCIDALEECVDILKENNI